MSSFPFDVLGSPDDAVSTAVETTVAATHTSLLKGIKNYLKTLASPIVGSKLQVTADAITGAVTATLATETTKVIGATKDGGPVWTSLFGVASVAVVSADMTTAAVVTSVPTAGQKIVITDIVVSADTPMSVLFEEETSGTDIFKVFIPANGTVQITTRGVVKLATADKRLTAKASVAGNIAVTVCYYSEA